MSWYVGQHCITFHEHVSSNLSCFKQRADCSQLFFRIIKQLAAHGKQNARSCGLRRSVAMTIIKLLPLKRALHNHWLSKIVWERWNKVSVGCLNFWCCMAVCDQPPPLNLKLVHSPTSDSPEVYTVGRSTWGWLVPGWLTLSCEEFSGWPWGCQSAWKQTVSSFNLWSINVSKNCFTWPWIDPVNLYQSSTACV